MGLRIVCTVLWVAVVTAAASRMQSCVPAKCLVGDKFRYTPGHTYYYNYETDVVTTISGSTDDFTSIFMEMEVQIHSFTSCEFSLKIRNVNLRSRGVDDPAPRKVASGYSEFKEALERYVVHFVFEDGVIDALCVDPGEKPWALNIKRAIVSMFQNRANISAIVATTTMEKDIQGNCPTTYLLDYYNWDIMRAKKTKDLNECEDRSSIISALQKSPLASPKDGRVNSVLRSTYTCYQTIEDLIFKKISCEERHYLRPFSNGNGSAATSTKQTLVYIEDKLEYPRSGRGVGRLLQTNLLFDYDYHQSSSAQNGRDANQLAAQETLQRICFWSKSDVQQDAPLQFWQLMRALKKLDYSMLKKFHENIDYICSTSLRGRKLFRDVLPSIGTVASVKLMVDLILSGSIPQSDSEWWLETIAFHPKPSAEMISTFMLLTKADPPSSKVLLSLSALMNSYCQKFTNCSSSDHIRDFIGILKSRLGLNCNFQKQQDIEEVIIALKALGNLGQWEFTASSILEQCVTTTSNPTVLRIAAIEAYRRLSCRIPREHLVHTFSNTEEDIEIRIAAYLGLMKCPTSAMMENLWKQLRYETINQVNSFVWSHLNAIKNSDDPCKSEVQAILEDVVLHNKYQQDIRKFSRAWEKSAFSELLNIGAHLEAHLIYSPQSFIPRSAMVNLTTDLFGQTINLLELNGRLEGFEKLAETLFRPEPHSKVIEINPEKDEGSIMSARSTKAHSLSHTIKSKVTSFKTTPANARFSMKIFGQEVWYTHAKNGQVEALARDSILQRYDDLTKIMAQQNSFEWSKDSILLDTTYAIPTLAGLPLILTINATASTHLKMGGKFDVRGLPETCDIEGQIRPSAAISLSGAMIVDGYVGKSGVSINAHLHTATVLDGNIVITDKDHIKVHLNLPRDKINFFQVKTDLILRKWDEERPLRNHLEDSSDVVMCSKDLTSRALGVDLCVEFKYPNATLRPTSPYFPLTGNTQIGLWLQKTDPRLTSYQFHYQFDKGLRDDLSSMKSQRNLLLSFLTPHSVVDREWTLSYADDSNERSMNIRLMTPFKKVLVKGRYNNDSARKGLSADVTIDHHQTFSIQAELGLTGRDNGIQYHPKLVISSASRTVLSLESFVDYSPDKFTRVQVSLEHLTVKPFIFKGDYIRSDDGQDVVYNAIINSPLLDSNIKGFLNMTDDGIISKSHLEYQRTGNPRKDTIDLTMKLRYTSPPSRSLTTTMATIDIHTSAWPEYNSIVHWNFQFAEGHVENTISVDTTERRQRVQLAHLQQILQYGGTLVSHHVDSTFGVKIPSKQVDFMFKVDHRNSERALFSKVLLRRSLDKEHGLEISIRDDSEEEWRVSGHLIILNSGSPSMISMNVTEKLSMTPTESHKYVWRLLTTGRPFGNITATMHYNNLNTDMAVSQGLRISMDGDVQFFGQGSMFLSVSEGHLKGDARFSDQNYHIALNYTEVRWKQYDGNFTIILSSKQRLYGKLFLNTDNEKSLHVDAKSNTTGRRVIAKTTIHHRDDHKEGRFYLEWDADRDPKQRLLLTALNERLPERGQVHVGFDYMEKTIGFLFNHYRRALPDTDFNIQQLETIVEWSGSKKLGADLNITSNREQRNIVGTLDVLTPVSQLLEEAVVSLTHSSDALGWKSDANLVVNRKLPFNLTSTGKYWRAGNQRYLDVTANANTPFEGFKRMGFGVQHSKASREISTKATVEWSPRDKIDLHLYGIIPNGTKFDEVIAHLNVNTPFSNFKNLIFGLDHRIDSNRINSSMKVLWNEREKLAISLRATSQRINSIYKGTGSLIVVTPPQTFGNFSMLLDHVHHTHGFSTHLTGLLPNDNFSWKGEGIFQRADLFTILRVGTDFESSTLNFGSGLKYEHHGSHFDSELRGNWKAKRLHFTAVGAYRSMTDFHFRGTSLTHLERFKTGAVILTNKMGDGSIVSELLGRLNNTDLRGIHLSGNWNWSEEASRNLDMNFRLNAPLPSLPYILLNVSHSRQHRSVLTTHVNGTWNDVDVVLNHVLTFRNWYHFSDTLVASLPFDGWQDLQMAIDQSWGEGHRRTSANLTVTQDTLLGISLNVEPRILQDGKRKINASGKLESSLWASRGIEIIVDHTDNREEYQPKIIVQTIKDPKTRLIDLNGFLRSFPGNKIWYLKINSPVLELKDVALTGMYSMSDTYLIFNVSVHTDTSTKWEVDGRLETDFYAPRVRFNIVTPQEGYRVAKFDGHYSVWTSQKLIIFIVQKEEWKLDIYGNGRFDPDDVDAGMVIQTPSSDVRTIHLNVSANWDKSRRRGFRTSLTWGDKKRIVINTYLQPYRNGVTTMSVSVTTPLPWLRNVDGVLKVSRKPDSRLLIETSVRWNRADVVEVLMILGQDRSTLFDHAISIKSTSPVVPQVAVILLSKTTSHLHTTKASLEMVGLTFNVDLEAKFHHRHTELQLVVLTPFISFPKGSLAGTIRHKSNDVHDINLILMLPIRGLGSITLNGSLTPIGIRAPKTTLSIATSKWSASLVTHYAPNNTGFLLTASTTPLLPIWQISEMELAWQTIFEDASLRALLIAEGGRHELLGRVKGPPSNRLLTGRVSSPLLKDKSPIEFQMHVQNQNPTDVHTELIIREANANKHRATLDINIDEPTSASLNFAGVTPLIGDGHWYNVSVDVRDTTTGIASLAVLTIPTGTYRWKSQYDRDLTSGLVSLLLDGETPIESMKRLKVYARKLGKEWDNVATNLEIVTPIKGYDSFGAALSTDHIFGQTFDAKVQLTTPFEGYEDIAFEEHITYDLNLRGISTETNFIFDGVKTVFGGRYTNGKEQPWEVGFGTRWHRIQGEHHDGNGTVNFQWHCPKEGSQFDHHSCQIQYKWSGTPWGGQGTWNYNGWRNFTGDTSVVVPVTGIDKVVVLAANDMLTNREAFKSRVVIQWAGRTVSDVLLEGITLKNGQKNASLSLITPFMSAHRVNGRGFVFRDDTDVMGGVNIDLNDVQIFRGLLGTSTKQDGPWKNRTLLLETENPWQPLGLAASVHRHPLIFTFQSSITRNLAELHNGTKSLKADLEILLKPYGRDIHMTVNHPRHRMDISATYHRAPSNFTHAATVRWGAASSLLAAYRVWRHDIHQTGNFGGQNVGIRWEHPNRVMMATADLIRKSNGVHSTHIDVNLDATGDQEKYMTLDVEYEDARDTAPHGRDHIVRMVFWHPRLFQTIQLNSTVSTGRDKDLLRSTVTWLCSGDSTEKFTSQVAIQRLFSSNNRSPTGLLVVLDANHDASNLDTHLVGHWSKQHDGFFANMSFTYLDRDRERLQYLIQSSGDFLDKGAKVQIQSPNHFTEFHLDIYRSDPDNCTLIFTKQMDRVQRHTSTLLYRPISSYLELNMTSAEDGGVRFSSGFKTPKELNFGLHHDSVGQEIRDANIVLRLNKSHFLTARAYWLPELAQNIQENIQNNLLTSHHKTVSTLEQLWDFGLSEILDKTRLLWDSFSRELQPVLDDIYDEMLFIKQDFEPVRKYLNDAYINNDFFLYDLLSFLYEGHQLSLQLFMTDTRNWDLEALYDVFNRRIESLREQLSSKWDHWRSWWTKWLLDAWNSFFQSSLTSLDLGLLVSERISGILSTLPTAVSDSLASFRSMKNELMTHISKLYSLGDSIKSVWDTIQNSVRLIKTWIKDKIVDPIGSWICSTTLYRLLSVDLANAFNVVVNFARYHLLDLVSKFVESIKVYMGREQKKIMDHLMNDMLAIRDFVWSFIPNLLNHPVLLQMTEGIQFIHQKVTWILRYYEIIPHGYLKVFEWYASLVELFTTAIEESSDRFDSQNYIQLETERGIIEMDQQLPFKWKSLKQRPQFSDVKEIQQFYRVWSVLSSWDEPNRLPPYSLPLTPWGGSFMDKFNYKTWLPPFPGHAILVGNHHYITFDGRIVESTGECSYILTHDSMDSNFTVFITNESRDRGITTRRSIGILIDDRELDIRPDFQVLVDGRKVELPHSFGNTAVVRESEKTLVRNAFGLTVTCHWTYDVCTIKVAGWYFGRLVGLLGTYNNEPVDDTHTRDTAPQPHNELKQWSDHWSISPSTTCRAMQDYTIKLSQKTSDKNDLCLKCFNNSFSIFGYCYEKIDPLPFLDMCHSQNDACTSAAAYVQACKAAGITIRIPRHCVKCHLPDGKVLHEADNITMNSTVKRADVVFIIEAKKCNREIVNVFEDLVNNVDGAMNLADIQTRRYATVVFGGSGVYDTPHVLTSVSEIFTDHRKVSSLTNFKTGRGTSDFFDAIRFAAKLPFQPGASKIFVALTCSIGESVEMRIDYPEVHRMLLEDGITVHLLLDREFEIKTSGWLFYGIDGIKAYTSKDSRARHIGDRDLRRQVMAPKDICVPIVLESNGTVFTTLHLYANKKISKNFLDVYSRRVAESAEMSICHACDCLPDEDSVGRIYCQPCIFPKPAHIYMDPSEFIDIEYRSIY